MQGRATTAQHARKLPLVCTEAGGRSPRGGPFPARHRRQVAHPPVNRQDTTLDLAGKTIFISGGSRGIGLAIALRAARDGANVVIAAKTADADTRLEGTIYTAAAALEGSGGKG